MIKGPIYYFILRCDGRFKKIQDIVKKVFFKFLRFKRKINIL